MPEAEEFEVTIDKEGRIRLDFRGMSESSYRRIKEQLEETVGRVEPIEMKVDQTPPVRLRGTDRSQSESEKSDKLKIRGRR